MHFAAFIETWRSTSLQSETCRSHWGRRFKASQATQAIPIIRTLSSGAPGQARDFPDSRLECFNPSILLAFRRPGRRRLDKDKKLHPDAISVFLYTSDQGPDQKLGKKIILASVEKHARVIFVGVVSCVPWTT